MHKLIAQWLSQGAQASLADLQRALERQNGLPEQPPVISFLISSKERAALPGANPSTHEQVFVTEDEEPRLGVFIDEGLLERLPKASAKLSLDDVRSLDDYCVAAEGVSHFLCLADKAERGISLFELELQAEVDKFVHLTEKLALAPNDHELLRRQLYERYVLHEHLTADETARYKDASRHAAKFTHRLTHTAKKLGTAAALREARSFFEAPLQDKLRKTA